MTKRLPALLFAIACIAGCQQQAPAAPPAQSPVATPATGAAPQAAVPSAIAKRPTGTRKVAGSHDGLFKGMVFPIAKADFITQLNNRLGDNCKRPDRRGRLCPKLEQRSTICASVVKRPYVADADAARDAGGKYLRCLHRGHV